MAEVGLLEDELRGIDGLIETAAVEEDVVEYLRLTMRKTAIPALLREAKAKPVRRTITRLEAELEDLEQERQRALAGPLPEVPAGTRDRITPHMMKNARVGGISAELSRVGKELDGARKLLARIEAEGAVPAEAL